MTVYMCESCLAEGHQSDRLCVDPHCVCPRCTAPTARFDRRRDAAAKRQDTQNLAQAIAEVLRAIQLLETRVQNIEAALIRRGSA